MATSRYITPGQGDDTDLLLAGAGNSLSAQVAAAAKAGSTYTGSGAGEESIAAEESYMSIGQALTMAGNVGKAGMGLMSGNLRGFGKAAYDVLSIDPLNPSKLATAIDDTLASIFGYQTPLSKSIEAFMAEQNPNVTTGAAATLSPENQAAFTEALFGDVVGAQTQQEGEQVNAADIAAISDALFGGNPAPGAPASDVGYGDSGSSGYSDSEGSPGDGGADNGNGGSGADGGNADSSDSDSGEGGGW